MLKKRLLFAYKLAKFKELDWYSLSPSEKKEQMLAINAHIKERDSSVASDTNGLIVLANPYETKYNKKTETVTIFLDFNDKDDIVLIE